MRTSQKTPETITTIGIDLGKNTFHLVGMDKRGAIALQRKVSRSQLEHRLCNVPRCLIGMGLLGLPSHRPPVDRSGPRRASDPGAVREAVSQRSQERLPRCRGGRGSCAAAHYALRDDQDAGTDGLAGSASCALAPRGPTDRNDQSNPRFPDRARHHCAAGRSPLAAKRYLTS